jgi:hypothetical protein
VAKAPYAADNRWLVAGLILFFVNRFLDRAFGLPVLDLALPVMVLGFALAERRVVQVTRLASFWIVVLIGIYLCFSFAMNHVQINSWPRRLIVVVTTFLPVVLFRVVKKQEPLIAFTVGCVVGFSLYFVFAVLLDLSHGSVSRELRGIQPTPVVALALYLGLKDKMSKIVRWTLIIATVASGLISLAIVARGPIVAVALGFALWPIAASRARSWALPLIAVLAFAGHFLYGLHTSAYAAVLESGQYTVSNAERAYAIDFCVSLIKSSPWFGQSPDLYGQTFAHSYDSLANILRQTEGVLSPHNSFLEYSVFYGLPSALLLLVFLWTTLRSGGARMAKHPLVYALVIAGAVRLGAFYGISGWIRIEWFALLFLLFHIGSDQVTAAVRPALGRRFPAFREN